jgi:HD-like signal output (HDOD) protein
MVISIEELLDVVEASAIKPLPLILQRIINLISDPDATIMDLKCVIDQDPPLTANILRKANSPYYGFRRIVTDVLDAIVIMGYDEIKELTLHQKLWELFRKENGALPGYSRLSLWIHCVGVALCSKYIYRRELGLRGHNIYTAGLLHDIGIIIEDQFLANEFAAIANLVHTREVNQHEAEERIIGFCHEDLGKSLLEKWDIPGEICQAVGAAERPAQDSPTAGIMADVLYVANYACQSKGIGYTEMPLEDRQMYQFCLKRLNVEDASMQVILEDVDKEIQHMRRDMWFS